MRDFRLSSGGSIFEYLYVLFSLKSGLLGLLYFYNYRNKMVFISLLAPKWYLEYYFYAAIGTIISINCSRHFNVSSNSTSLA